MPNSSTISIRCRSTNPSQEKKASLLASQLKVPLLESSCFSGEYQLVYTDERLELHGPSSDKEQKHWHFYTDFIGGKSGFRRIHNTTIKQPLAKAVGIKSGFRPFIVDATAGRGEDSFVFACLGCKVTLIERSPIFAALLQDGMDRALRNSSTSKIIQENMQLISGDAMKVLKNISPQPDTIYLDPMYPHKKKSALNKKEMRMIRTLVGDDQDASKLFSISLEYASNRVVVKRPKGAETISNISPSYKVKMKNSRFDVYLISVKK